MVIESDIKRSSINGGSGTTIIKIIATTPKANCTSVLFSASKRTFALAFCSEDGALVAAGIYNSLLWNGAAFEAVNVTNDLRDSLVKLIGYFFALVDSRI